MKKKPQCGYCPRQWLEKMFRIMKVYAILFFFGLTVLHAESFSQVRKVSLDVSGQTLLNVLDLLQEESGYTFLFSSSDIQDIDGISLKMKNKSVTDVLETCLKGTGLSYELNGNLIVLKKQDGRALPQVQEKMQIRGMVSDKNGGALPGVSIVLKGTSLGVVTDVDGSFRFELPKQKELVLVLSFIGMKKLEVTYKGEEELRVVMEDEVAEIQEVVVTGIFQRKKESYTGAVKTVTGKELQQFGNRNILTSLRNIDPSFNIVANNAFGNDPNKLPEIQIRGNSSLPNVDVLEINELRDETRAKMNTPLVIIDGFESTLQRLIDMNDNDVETITLLKDASATAIYGSRGANGVIMVSTKVPQMGKLRISYRGDVTVEMPDLSTYDLLNAKDKLALEKRVGVYDFPNPDDGVKVKNYYNYLLNEVNRGVDTYWLSAPLRTGVGQRHNLRLDGGDKTFRYSASIQYNETQGVMKESQRKNLNGGINLSYFYKNIKFVNNLTIGLNNNQESPYGTFSDYVKLNPYWRAYDENGNVLKVLGDHPYARRIWSTATGLPANPLYNATLNTFDKKNSFEVTNNFSVDWDILPELTVRARFGVTKTTNQSDNFKPADHTDFEKYEEDDLLLRGKYIYGTGNSFKYDASLNLSYSKTFQDKHSLFAGFDWNIRQDEGSNYSFAAEGFTNENFAFLPLAMQYARNGKPSGSEHLTRAIGMTASINYTYDNRYYADLSGRLDGASQFGSNKRFAPFWSAGLGWNLHNEQFLKGNGVINHFKLRGSAGITGSQSFDAYQALATYRYFMNDRYDNWMGAELLGIGNEDLTWQQKMNYNLGFELQLWDGKVALEADYYTSTTQNLLSSVELPAANGFTSYTENVGKMKNTGLELQATVYVLRNPSKRISWAVTGSIMHNKNEIVEISRAMADAQKKIEMSKGSSPTVLFREGYSTNTIWVVPSLGIDPSNGKEVFLDRNGNATYTWDARDLADAGLSEPKFQGNLNSTFRYRGLTVNLSFGYRFGGQLYNQTLIDRVENADYRYNVDARVYTDRWTKVGDRALFKGLDVTSKTEKTSRFVQDERTLNFQNINVAYDFRSPALQKCLGLDVLTLSGNMSDIFYLSTVKRERGTSYPFSRQASFTLSATF